MKTFREYLNECVFEAVWPEIQGIFGEPDGLRPVYAKFYEKLRVLPARQQTRGEIKLDLIDPECPNQAPEGIDGAPDYIIDKPVNTKRLHDDTRPEQITAALIYWSSMMSFTTSKDHDDDLFEWLRLSEEDNPQAMGQYLMKSIETDPYENLKDESLRRKRKLFWGETTTNSEVTCWHGILKVLKRKLELNLIFQRGYADHEGRERDAERMELCCRLIDIATSERENIGEPQCQRALHLLFKVLEDNLWRWDD